MEVNLHAYIVACLELQHVLQGIFLDLAIVVNQLLLVDKNDPLTHMLETLHCKKSRN